MTHEADTSPHDAEQLTEGSATWGMIRESLAHTAALLTKASSADADTLRSRVIAPSGDGPRTDDHATAALKALRAAQWIVSSRLAADHVKSAEYAAHGSDEALGCMRDAHQLTDYHRQSVADEGRRQEERFSWTDAEGKLQAGTLEEYAEEWAAGYETQGVMPSWRVTAPDGSRWPVVVEQVNEGGQLKAWRLSVLGRETLVPAEEASDGVRGR